ncbi:amidohydrolase [Actinacidiphila acidipaludis]|uniref:amidohydrolase n=1 Tax=Actinacidiphila acidipaludis TaxID=2873382 RepID=UPI0027E01950|nr:amidohydrolase [Streptomyces acidipaludis]
MDGAQGHLVDAQCHGVLQGELGLGSFEARLPGTPAPHTTLFDSPAGFAVRRWCPPLLGLEPHCPPARYLARRRELGAYEAARRLLRGTGVSTYLVETGEPGDLTPPKDLGAVGGAATYEIVRLEPLAQQVADTSGTVDGFLANLAEAVHAAAQEAAGFSCGTGFPAPGGRHARAGTPGVPAPWPAPDLGPALRGRHARPWDEESAEYALHAEYAEYAACPDAPGSGGGPRPPGAHVVRYAAARWLATRAVGGRLTDEVLRRHLVWHAVATGLPLALGYEEAGPGPRAAVDFLHATAGLGTDVVLMPGARHETAAAELATALPHVYVALGGDPSAVLARTPFGKVLYASGAAGLPELYVTGARAFRAGLGRLVDERVAAGEWSAADGERVAVLVGEGNARRVYGLPVTAAGRVPHPRLPCADTLGRGDR